MPVAVSIMFPGTADDLWSLVLAGGDGLRLQGLTRCPNLEVWSDSGTPEAVDRTLHSLSLMPP